MQAEDQHISMRVDELIEYDNRQKTIIPNYPASWIGNRRIIAEWLCDVAEESELPEVSVHESLLIIDEFVVNNPGFSKGQYQLLAIVVFKMSARTFGYDIHQDDMVELCAGMYVTQEFIKMETDLRARFDLNVVRLTPLHFLCYYVDASMVPGQDLAMSTALPLLGESLINLSLFDQMALNKFPPSKIAAAAVSAARKFMGMPQSEALYSNDRYTEESLAECEAFMSEYCHVLNAEPRA